MTDLDRDTGRSLAYELVGRLKERILTGELAPGTRLPTESSLTTEYAVSRTVVREAISRLQAAGLVETFQGRGSFVLELPPATEFSVPATRIRSHRDVLDMLEFRTGVEVEAAGLAAHRRTEHQLKAISRALTTFAKTNPAKAVEADFTFHLKIAAATGNRFYTELLGSLGPMMIMLPRTRLDTQYALTDETHFARVLSEHENIHDAIARQDPEAARAAVRVHLSNSRHRLREP